MNQYCGFITTLDFSDDGSQEEKNKITTQEIIDIVKNAFDLTATEVTFIQKNGSIGISFFNFSNHDAGLCAIIEGLFTDLGSFGPGIYGFCSCYDDEWDGVGRHVEYRFNYPEGIACP